MKFNESEIRRKIQQLKENKYFEPKDESSADADFFAKFINRHNDLIELMDVNLTDTPYEQTKQMLDFLRDYNFYMVFDYCNLNKIPEFLSDFQFLQGLDFCNNKINVVGDEILDLPVCKELRLSGNPITKLPDFVHLSSLEILSISFADGVKVPEQIWDLHNLKELLIYSSDIKQIPTSIEKMRNLKRLEIANCGLEVIPKEIALLTELTTLSLTENKLQELPDEITELENLEFLDLRCNQLESLPDNMGRMLNLLSCYLSNNQIEKLPEAFISHTECSIDLSDNKLRYESIPSEFWRGKSRVILKRNLLELLPDSEDCLKTNILDFDGNKLKVFPESLMHKDLNELNLSNNNIDSLPDSFNKCRLVNLLLSNNNITDLPESLFSTYMEHVRDQTGETKLQKVNFLRRLHLDGNPLKSIPESITGLPSLSRVRISRKTFDASSEKVQDFLLNKIFRCEII